MTSKTKRCPGGHIAAILALLLICIAGHASQGQLTPDEAIQQLTSIAWNVPLRDWRSQSGDVAGPEKPEFDDSTWQTASPEFDYGQVPTAWIRKTIVIPDEIGGFPVKGSKVTFRAGIDDDGECYVNGELTQKFHWDGCRVVLTENAQPGDKFVIALKAMNGQGSGRLLFAELEFGMFDDMRSQVADLVNSLNAAKRLADREQDERLRESYRTALDKSVVNLDMTALEKGDKQAFVTSIAAAERELKPVGHVLKDYTVHLIGHAHIDMNWLWLWPETMDVCKNTFRTVTKLLAEYPEFRFSQSQASTYLAVEEADPELFAEIQKWVKTGRWEVTGGTWVEGDMNMASGESIVRQILYAKRYFKEKFGVEPVTCWEPDTFGHAWTIPQILVKSGVKYYFFMRCGRNEPIFWWEGPDGSRVLAYNRPSYNEPVTDGIMDSPLDIGKRYDVRDGMVVYGVGDHGGGPTRKDLDKAVALQKSHVYVNVQFDTTKGLYDRLLQEKKDWPIVRDELNFEFRGCYTAHSDIKKMNRELENLLPTAEAFSALAGPYGFPCPAKGLEDAWRNTCFNQFHDIFDGTAIHGSYDYSRQLFNKAYGVGSSALQRSLDTLAGNVDTTGKGTPIIVFNPMSWKRTDVVRMDPPQGPDNVSVRDAARHELPAQIVEGRLVFTAKDVPSMGYKVFYISQGEPSDSSSYPSILENEFLRVEVDSQTGTIARVYDKQAGREVLAEGEKGDQLQILFEGQGLSAWSIGPITGTQNLDSPVSVEKISDGPVSIIRIKHKFGSSTFSQDIILYAGVPRIDFKLTANWHERSGPMLKVAFPLNVQDGKARFEIPFGSIERPANGDEVPAQKWVDLSGKDYGVSLLNDCKYGHDVKDNVIYLTLLRSSNHPDPVPDDGRHIITYSLYPHSGDWQADSVRRGYELNNPLIPVTAKKHNGRLPKEHSFLQIEPANMIVTALKKAEDSSDVILRFYDCTGGGGKAIIKPGFEAAGFRETDLMERPIRPLVPLNGRTEVPVGKWEIKTLRIEGVGR